MVGLRTTRLKMKLPLQDTERVKSGLRDAITLLCKTGLNFESELNINGLLGITLDNDEVFLVDIKEVIKNSNDYHSVSKDERRRRKSSTVTRLRVAEYNNEDSDTETEYPCSKHPRLDNQGYCSSVESQNGSESLSQPPQRFVRNTEVWFPEPDSDHNQTQETVVIQPRGDYDEQSCPSSECSQQSDVSCEPVQELPLSPTASKETSVSENTQSDLRIPSDNSQNQKPTKGKTLEQALNKLNPKQSDDGNEPVSQKHHDNNSEVIPNQEEDKPINLSSRSASRNDLPEAVCVKEEPLDSAMLTPVTSLFTNDSVGLPTGALPAGILAEQELHARWLQNIAANVGNVIHSPLALPNHVSPHVPYFVMA